MPGPADRAYDGRRAQTTWRAWYKTARWARVRAQQLQDEPLCRMCVAADEVRAATVCDHLKPHRGAAERFWAGPFQSLCAAHHSAEKQREEQADLQRRGIWD